MDGNGVAPRLDLVLESKWCSSFHPFLQKGVGVETPVGISVRAFLCGELGLTPAYVEGTVQTIFLNGRAVDDLDAALIENGSTLALSAAMPGLLGATLRKGSFYAAMRSQISYRPAESSGSGTGRILVKIFNLLLEGAGRILLERGVWVKNEDLQELFNNIPEGFWSAIREAKLDGRSITALDLRKMEWGGEEVFLRVKPVDEGQD